MLLSYEDQYNQFEVLMNNTMKKHVMIIFFSRGQYYECLSDLTELTNRTMILSISNFGHALINFTACPEFSMSTIDNEEIKCNKDADNKIEINLKENNKEFEA
jgi:hypothetical protein